MALVANVVAREYVDLASLDASGMPVGTFVSDVLLGNQFVLTVSTATVDHVDTESVLNQPTLRWIKFTGGGVGTVTTAAPLSGNGSALTPVTATAAALQDVTQPAVTSGTLVATATNVDLDVTELGDGDYEVSFYCTRGPAGATTITLQPNAGSSNQECIVVYADAVSSPTVNSAIFHSLYAFGTTTAGDYVLGRLYLKKTSTGTHFYHCDAKNMKSDNTPRIAYITNGEWHAGTAITSLRLHSDLANGIGIGSVFTARRMVLL